MAKPKRYTVTAALPYANGPIHIGHLAGCYLPADIYVRYLRQRGENVKFICGSDEHGVPIIMKAKKEGISPQDVVDKYHGIMSQAFEEFGISFDIYSRTSKEIHHQTASDFFLKLYEKGSFIEKETKQYFDQESEQFLADRYIQGECPHCSYSEAYGDQCENCGILLSPIDLKNPKSRLSGVKLILKKTVHWFLPLDHLSRKIKKYIESHKDWKSNVYGQCVSWLDNEGGLRARSMTRDLEWGIPVPIDKAKGKVLYVWFDAPIGYISATKELLRDSWETYWKDEKTSLIHFIGKDNIVFHCITFPAMLMEYGEFILPDQVPANEFLNLEGRKISTSRNWAVWLHEYLKDFENQQDVLRYALCVVSPETKDNNFTWKDFQIRNNSELVAIFGNLVNRVLMLINKYYNGVVPELAELSSVDHQLLGQLEKAPQKIGGLLSRYRFREALSSYMDIARAGNKYLTDEEPWRTIKTDEKRTAITMHVAAQVCGQLSQLGEPFLPFTAAKLRNYLGLDLMNWNNCITREFVLAGSTIQKGDLLFKKIEDKQVREQINKLNVIKGASNP